MSEADVVDDIGDSAVWIRSMPAWHACFALLITLCAAGMYVVAPVWPAIEVTLLIVALGVAYAVFGVRAAETRVAWARWSYLSIAAVVLLLATMSVPAASVMLFVLYPQCWLLSERDRDGILATLLLTAAAAAGPVFGGEGSWADLRTQTPSIVVGCAFSLALGLYVLRLIDQSRERAELLERLTAAQEELASAHHTAGVVAERERLAAEIHDTLAQGFTSIAMQAEAALAQHGQSPDADRLRLIARTARDNLAEARALVEAFSPAPLEDAVLVDAVLRVASRFEDETGVGIEVNVIGLIDGIHRDHEVVLLRAVQEGLSNVRKHADARHVTVTLSAVDDTLTAEVRDDGVGFADRRGTGFGISTMTTRLRDVGGVVDLTSDVGLGTTLRVAIPLTDAGRDVV